MESEIQYSLLFTYCAGGKSSTWKKKRKEVLESEGNEKHLGISRSFFLAPIFCSAPMYYVEGSVQERVEKNTEREKEGSAPEKGKMKAVPVGVAVRSSCEFERRKCFRKNRVWGE